MSDEQLNDFVITVVRLLFDRLHGYQPDEKLITNAINDVSKALK